MNYNYKKENYENYLIVEDEYQVDYLGKTESIFCLGNGYLGLRSSNEECSANTIRNMFLNGVFNIAGEGEVSELANILDIVEMTFKINGKSVPFNEQTITKYHKELNLLDGLLTRFVTVETVDYKVDFEFERFVSMDNKHVVGQKVSVVVDQDCELQICSGINGQVSNTGAQHFNEGVKRLYNDIMQQVVSTNQSGIEVCVNSQIKVNQEVKELILMDRRKIFKRIDIKANMGKKVELTKLSYVCSSIDLGYESEIGSKSHDDFKVVLSVAYEELKKKSVNVWNQYWVSKDVKIGGFDYGQLAIRYSLYHLRANTNVDDCRMNIGAKGLSGEGYKGHAFWDTELFMLPYFIYTNPKAAKNLIKYRYLGLEGAHKKAKNMGYEGAMYPWESAWPSDGEVTPIWGAADIKTGKAIKIESGFIQLHITSDVVYGLWLYAKVSGDDEIFKEFGFEILLDTAKFWLSRVEKTSRGYELKQIMGPNEYKEFIDNDAFTNYMMKWSIDLTIKYINEYKLNEMVCDYGYTIEDLIELSENIVLPKVNSDMILPENDTFLELNKIDLTKYKNQENVGLIFEDYNLHDIQNMMVCKQADVLVLFLLLEDLFTHDQKVRNFDFYEGVTLHDSSLSLSTHSVLASDLKNEKLAYDLYLKSLDIDLGDNMKTSDHGIHLASYGGMWQSVVYGFGGVRFANEMLRIEPALPVDWTNLEFKIKYMGCELTIKVYQGKFIVKNNGNRDIEFVSNNNVYQVSKNEELTVN